MEDSLRLDKDQMHFMHDILLFVFYYFSNNPPCIEANKIPFHLHQYLS